jgi:anti-sigma B factor antagonist
MYSALASSASFRRELLELADELEEISVDSEQNTEGSVDVLFINQEVVPGPGEIVVFGLKGLIPRSHAELLGQELDGVIAEGHTRIVVDLSRVSYVGSAGWLAFSSRVIHLRRRGGDIKLAGLRPHVRAIFELVRLDAFLDAYPTAEAAIAKFSRSGPPDHH